MMHSHSMYRVMQRLTRTGDRLLKLSHWRSPAPITQTPEILTDLTDPLLALTQQLAPLTGSQHNFSRPRYSESPSTRRRPNQSQSPLGTGNEGVGQYLFDENSAPWQRFPPEARVAPVESAAAIAQSPPAAPAVQQIFKTMEALNLAIAPGPAALVTSYSKELLNAPSSRVFGSRISENPVSETLSFEQFRFEHPDQSPASVASAPLRSQDAPFGWSPAAQESATSSLISRHLPSGPSASTVQESAKPSVKGLRLSQNSKGLASLLQAHLATPNSAAVPEATGDNRGLPTAAAASSEQHSLPTGNLSQKAPSTRDMFSQREAFPSGETTASPGGSQPAVKGSAKVSDLSGESISAHLPEAHLSELEREAPAIADPSETPEMLDLDQVMTALTDQLTFEFLRTYGSPPGEGP